MLNERKLTENELKARESALRGLKSNKHKLVQKYGADAEQVMYGIATKQAKKKVEKNNLESIKELIKKSLTSESYMGNKREEYMISKGGQKSRPHYVLEKPDGSAQIDMTFSSPDKAKEYAEKKGLKVSSKPGYNVNENEEENELSMHPVDKLAKALSNIDQVKYTVNPEIDSNNFSLDLPDEEFGGGSYQIKDDGAIINVSLPDSPTYGHRDDTVQQLEDRIRKVHSTNDYSKMGSDYGSIPENRLANLATKLGKDNSPEYIQTFRANNYIKHNGQNIIPGVYVFNKEYKGKGLYINPQKKLVVALSHQDLEQLKDEIYPLSENAKTTTPIKEGDSYDSVDDLKKGETGETNYSNYSVSRNLKVDKQNHIYIEIVVNGKRMSDRELYRVAIHGDGSSGSELNYKNETYYITSFVPISGKWSEVEDVSSKAMDSLPDIDKYNESEGMVVVRDYPITFKGKYISLEPTRKLKESHDKKIKKAVLKSAEKLGINLNLNESKFKPIRIWENKNHTNGGIAGNATIGDLAEMHNVSLKEIIQQLEIGTKVELEHTSSINDASKVAMDHIYEDPEYYTKLSKAGLEEGEGNSTLNRIKDEIESLRPNPISWIDSIEVGYKGDLDINLDYELNADEIKQLSQIASKYDMQLLYKTGKNATLTKKAGELNELNIKRGSYPATLVVSKDGKVINQERVNTPELAPAIYRTLRKKYPDAIIKLEDNTGKIINEMEANEFLSTVNDEFDIETLELMQSAISKRISLLQKMVDVGNPRTVVKGYVREAMAKRDEILDLIAHKNFNGKDYKKLDDKDKEWVKKDAKKRNLIKEALVKVFEKKLNEVKAPKTKEELEKAIKNAKKKRDNLPNKISVPGGGSSFSSSSVEGKKNRKIDSRFQKLTYDIDRWGDKLKKINKGKSSKNLNENEKRYKIQGTSFTTNSKKWFEFSEYEWQEFKHRQWTHYPAWSFDSSTITEF